jgi:hypothetical protein
MNDDGLLIGTGYKIVPGQEAKTDDGEWIIDFKNPQYSTTQGQPTSAIQHHGFLMLPVEVVDSSRTSPLRNLKVAKLSNADALDGSYPSTKVNINIDPDHFYIRIPNGAFLGKATVTVETMENPDPAFRDSKYKNPPVQVDLEPSGNDLISKSLLLMSDQADDGHRVDGIEDDAPNDRTFIVQLGGSFVIRNIKTDKLDSKVYVAIPVPASRTVDVAVIIMRDEPLENGGKLPITEAEVLDNLKVMRERFAQAQVNFTWTITTKDAPLAAKLWNMEFCYEDKTATEDRISEEAKLLIEKINSSASYTICYVNQIKDKKDRFPRGVAFFPKTYSHPDDKDYLNHCFIDGERKTMFTLAHEMGHLLTNDGHTKHLFLLMRGGGTSDNNNIVSSKRLLPDQADAIHTNLAKKESSVP